MGLIKVAFNFDEQSLAELEKIRLRYGLKTVEEAIITSLSVYRRVIKEYLQGYEELAVRNPKTGEERTFTPEAILWG
ncbi:MAG: hypothetical protein AABX11_02850 [Nanoarchaeota archaeon]